MKRVRINLILGVLLYPITDPKIQERDYLYEKYIAYKKLISLQGTNNRMLEEKSNKLKKYRASCENVIRYLVDSCRCEVSSYDDLQMLCELYYPLLEMERSVEQIREEIKLPHGNTSDDIENTALFYLNQMRRIAKSLLTYRDGIMAIRTWNNGETDIFCTPHVFDKVEIWNMLNSYVSPDLFIALFIIENGLGEEALYGQKPHISLSDKLLVKVLRKGMAENHLHFNVGFDYEAVWLNKMNLWNCHQYGITFEETRALEKEAALFRFLAAAFLLEKQDSLFSVWANEFYGGMFAAVVSALYTGQTMQQGCDQMIQQILEQLGEEAVQNRTDYLLYTMFPSKVELKTSSEFILLYYSCRYIWEQPWDTGFARIFLQYIRIKNMFIHRTQQSDLIPGLKHFQKFYARTKQEYMKNSNAERLMIDVFRSQSKIVGLKKLEIRIAPNINLERLCNLNDHKAIEEIKLKLCRQMFDVLYRYRKYILESVLGVQETEIFLQNEKKLGDKGEPGYKLLEELLEAYSEKINEMSIPVVGIVFHFLKSESTDNISGYYCWRDMDEVQKSYNSHRFFLRERVALVGIAIEQLRSEIPKLNEYVVGIDAASDENAMEPWMFSPVYVGMRSQNVVLPVGKVKSSQNVEYYNINNIGFTYHVGEDYRHLVSGLRHIDEVIERFRFKPGDRLGHALALGKDIRTWIHDTEAVVLPIQEYMENLLWIWGKGINGEVEIPVPMEMLEEKIMQCAKKIYKNISGITVRMLYQAYDKKFLTKHRKILRRILEEEKQFSRDKCGNASCDREQIYTYCRMTDSNCMVYGGLWTEERLISTLYCPVFEERRQRVEMVPVRENEMILYQNLQEYLLKKVAMRGIYVETNPTSNLNIADLKDLNEHPIFRLSPLKETADQVQQRIMVMINSDDPAVFNTNVENELAYVYYALEHAGYAKEDILNWIDKVRQNGMDGSFIAKLKDCKTLLTEISGILEILKKFC